MVLETHMKLYVTELDFLEKIFSAPKHGKMGHEQGFFEFIEIFGP